METAPGMADGWTRSVTAAADGAWVTLDTNAAGLDGNLDPAPSGASFTVPEDGTYLVAFSIALWSGGAGPGAVSGEMRLDRAALVDTNGNVVMA
jgi:hypothetical protein